jgi:hypothetical protein
MIATDPDDTHAYNVADFESLSKIVDDLTINLCNSVKGPGKFSPEFRILSTIDILVKIILFWMERRGCFVQCDILSSINSLCLLDAGSIPNLWHPNISL